MLLQSPIKNDESIKNLNKCVIHLKDYITTLYCFFHQVKICPDCLIEHQYPNCKIKNWNNSDTLSMLNEVKSKFSKINDIEKIFNENLNNFEHLLTWSTSKAPDCLDVFNNHSQLISDYNKMMDENAKNGIFSFQNDNNFLQSSMNYTIYLNLLEKLKEKKIILTPEWMKFISSNFKVNKDFDLVNSILQFFPNLLIYGYNKSNDNSKLYIKNENNYYNLEIGKVEKEESYCMSDLSKIHTVYGLKFSIEKSNDSAEIYLNISEEREMIKKPLEKFRYFDFFIFDNIFPLINNLNLDLNSISNIQILYFNDKYFVFDFLNLIDIVKEHGNTLKITYIKREENENINNINKDINANNIEINKNIYIKFTKFTSTISEFIVDYIIMDQPFFYKKINKVSKIRKDSVYFKTLSIDNICEISNGNIKLNLGNFSTEEGKLQSLTYFRFKNTV
jgi:hypothetical protein